MKQNPLEHQKPKEEIPAIPEYDFEGGVNWSIEQITKLLENQPYVVIAFSCPSTRVGKTTLAVKIMEILYKKGIIGQAFQGLDEVEKVREGTMRIGRNVKVFIFSQLEWGSENIRYYKKRKEYCNQEVSTELKKIGYDVGGIDLWIGIFRPDKPFATKMESGDPAKPFADILIKNDLAKND